MIYALVGHLVGDYLLQNDWMALNKKTAETDTACGVHCTIWTASVCLFAGWDNYYAILFLMITHMIQDRTNIVRWWMSLVGQDKFATGPCAPWSIIVVDNVWHILAIWFVDRMYLIGVF